MASTLEELRANIEAAVVPEFRYKLLARGQSRGMIWRDGILPPDAPNFSPELSDDLLSYGYSLLLHGLRYSELGGDPGLARVAFEVAAEALEAVVARGAAEPERDFHRLAAAAAYHLGRYSARAYSLLHKKLAELNLSTIEMSLAKLMLRDLDGLARDIANWFGSGIGSDDALIASLAQGTALQADGSDEDGDDINDHLLEALTTALDGNFMAASITAQHYAFLISEHEFDEIFARILERKLAYWADPMQQEPNRINTRDGGRGLYFEDPNGHLLEILTRPYGSGG